MGVKVVKFGGSSVADAIQLQKVKAIIESDPDRKYVVVSAPGKRYSEDNKITDLLYLIKTHLDHKLPSDQIYQVVCDRFKSMEVSLGVNAGLAQELDVIKSRMSPDMKVDYLVSRGEYLSAKLTAAYLGYDFVDTEGLVKFDGKGRFLADETHVALSVELAKHERAVIPGFYGSMPDGSIKTFSRGGSDVTGSLVAKAVQAEVYENWTDVSGFLMADPRIVDNPLPIKNITYKELRELSYMGASVLHEDAVFPVREANIPINIRNTNEPEHPGTFITDTPHPSENIITGVAGKKDFTVIALYKNMMNSEIGFIKRLLTIMETNEVSVEHLPSGIDTVCLIVENKQLEGKLSEIISDIEKKLQPDSINIYENIALVATVGVNMNRRLGVAATLFGALEDAKVNVRMIDQGSSEMNIIIGVENEQFPEALRAIYHAFVNEKA